MIFTLNTFSGSSVWLISSSVLISLFGIRFLLFKTIKRKNINPEVWIAPRGLISILLYYAIPEEFLVRDFESGVLFIIIITTALIMAISLMINKRKSENADEEPNLPIEQ